MLTKAGYKINAVPGAGSSLENLKEIANAKLNIVCNEELGLQLAQYLEKRFGTPYVVAGMPYGIEGTKNWLTRIHEALPCENLQVVFDEGTAQMERLTAKENDYRGVWGSLWFDKVILSAAGTQALCMAQALRNEWLDMGELIVICQHEVKSADYCDAADKILVTGKDVDEIEKLFQNAEDVLLLASSSETSNLRRRGARFYSCNIAYPSADEVLLTETPFVGIKGAAHLLERLWNVYVKKQMDEQVDK